MIGFSHHFNENIGLKSMSNIQVMMSLKDVPQRLSLYNDNQVDEIGPAPAGPAELAHNMTLQLSFCLGLPPGLESPNN